MTKPLRHHMVVVGNIGTVVDSKERGAYTVARKAFEEYRQMSKDDYGRAAGEDVTWFMEGEPYYTYYGKRSQDAKRVR
jgi:hypothetical protein